MRRSPSCSSRSATPPASSARTTSATATNICQRCTASTSSSATSITSTPRRSRSRGPIRTTRVPRKLLARAACCAARRPTATIRPTSALGQGRQADHRGHRPAHQEADGDDRRRNLGGGHRFHASGRCGPTRPFFCWFNSTRMHFRTHVRAEHRDKPGLTSRTEYADGMIEHDAVVGTILKAVDDLGIGNNTIVLYTTDNGPHQNSWPDAGDDAVPQREEHQLGRRVPRAVPDPLAGTNSDPAQSRTRSSAASTGCRPWWRPPAIPTSRTSCSRATGRRQDLQGPSRRLQPASLPHGPAAAQRAQGVLLLQRRRRPRRDALRELEGRVRGAARAQARCESGPSRSPSCACRNSSTCAPIPTSARTSRRTPITTGSCRTERLRSSRRKPSWRISGHASRIFRRASGRRASASIRCDGEAARRAGPTKN